MAGSNPYRLVFDGEEFVYADEFSENLSRSISAGDQFITDHVDVIEELEEALREVELEDSIPWQ